MNESQTSTAQVRYREREIKRRRLERCRKGNPYEHLEKVAGISTSVRSGSFFLSRNFQGPALPLPPRSPSPTPSLATMAETDGTIPLVSRMRGVLQLANGDAAVALQYMSSSHLPAAPVHRFFLLEGIRV